MSESEKEACKLRGESVNGQLSPTQQALWDRLHRALSEFQTTNADFSNRASWLLGASVGSMSATCVVVSVQGNPNPWLIGAATIAAFVSLVMVRLAGSLWKPRDTWVVGNSNIEAMYENYLSREIDDAWFLMMKDTAFVYDSERDENVVRGRRIRWMLWCLDAQIALLILVMILHAVGSF